MPSAEEPVQKITEKHILKVLFFLLQEDVDAADIISQDPMQKRTQEQIVKVLFFESMRKSWTLFTRTRAE